MAQLGNGVWTVFVTERKLDLLVWVRWKELAEQARLKHRAAMIAKLESAGFA